MHSRLIAAVACCVLGAGASAVRGQCMPGWSDAFPYPDLDGPVYATVHWDDGTGDRLYVGGTFLHAGGIAVNGLAAWDGSAWSAVGPLLASDAAHRGVIAVDALAVHDDGSGPALFVGGNFVKAGGVDALHLAKWDGSVWSAVPGIVDTPIASGEYPPGVVRALASFDDGSGPALFVAMKSSVQGVASTQLAARWKSGAWSALGSGVSGYLNAAYAFETFNDGSGEALYVAGAGKNSTQSVLKWKAGSLQTLMNLAGVSGTVWCMRAFDDGSGPALYFGGQFDTVMKPAGTGLIADNVARWTGSAWANVGSSHTVRASGANTIAAGGVLSMRAFERNGVKRLAIGGNFTNAPTKPTFANLVLWNGSAFEYLGADWDVGTVGAMGAIGPTGSESLVVGNVVTKNGALLTNIPGVWDGSAWSPMSGVLRNSPERGGARVVCAAMLNGISEVLISRGAGGLTGAADPADEQVSRWDGSAWHATSGASRFDAGPDVMRSMTWQGVPVVFFGERADYSASNPASAIVMYDGANWTVPGAGIVAPVAGSSVTVAAIEKYAGRVIAAGRFTDAGGAAANNIAAWDGSAWSALGGGITNSDGSDPSILALKAAEENGVEVLYAAGMFDRAGGIVVENIAKWDGVSWSGVVTGAVVPYSVQALEVFDDGTGPALYGAAYFQGPGQKGAVARLDAAGWTIIGAGAGLGRALIVFDDGGGAQLYAGGSFDEIAGVPDTAGLARWNGSSWSEVDGGVGPLSEYGPSVDSLAVADLGDGPSLFVGGDFMTAGGAVGAGGVLSGNFAQWNPCRGRCLGDFDGDGFVEGGDFDDFMAVFEAGGVAADVNTDGWVSGDDFDAFAWAFAGGC